MTADAKKRNQILTRRSISSSCGLRHSGCVAPIESSRVCVILANGKNVWKASSMSFRNFRAYSVSNASMRSVGSAVEKMRHPALHHSWLRLSRIVSCELLSKQRVRNWISVDFCCQGSRAFLSFSKLNRWRKRMLNNFWIVLVESSLATTGLISKSKRQHCAKGCSSVLCPTTRFRESVLGFGKGCSKLPNAIRLPKLMAIVLLRHSLN